MKTKELDRISNLGFDININWNQDISIHFPFNPDSDFTLGDGIFVLIYVHNSDLFSFVDIITLIVNEFDSWYNINKNFITEYLFTGNTDLRNKIIGLGDITNKVTRDIKINGLLEGYDF